MRRTIYDVLNSGNVDIEREYSRIYDLFYNVGFDGEYGHYITLEGVVNEYFTQLNKNLIGRCLTLEDFDESYGYRFLPQPISFNIDTLIDISEYVFNFVRSLIEVGRFNIQTIHNVLHHIETCMNDVGYIRIEREGIVFFVESDSAAISVAETLDGNLAYRILEYNHHKLRGKLDDKKNILKGMAENIELERKRLNSINKNFSSDLFQLLNKFIRHDSSSNEYISLMSVSELEKLYDEIYQMWLLAKLMLEQADRSSYISEIIKAMN